MITLTPEQIRAMQAGREMDAAVAETVMGWTRYPKQPHPSDNRTIDGVLYCPPDAPYDMNARNVVPDYSDDIACAFKMQAEIARCDLWEEYVRQLVLLLTDAEHAAETIWYADENDWWAVANASPLGRCKAALIVMAGRQDAARGEM